ASEQEGEGELRAGVVASGGRLVSRARIDDIAYHGLLVDLPVRAVREITRRSLSGIVSLEPVMHIRPQSVAGSIEVTDPAEITKVGPLEVRNEPILALL